MSDFLQAVVGAAIGAPLGMWVAAKLSAWRDELDWQRTMAAFEAEGEGD